jgi:hypothetical protein
MKADMTMEAAIADDPSVMSMPVFSQSSAMLSTQERKWIVLRKLEGGGPSPINMAFPNTEHAASRAYPRTVMARSSQPTAPSIPTSISTTTAQATKTIPTARRESPVSASGGFDITHIPKRLDSTIEEHLSDYILRTSVIETGNSWTPLRQESLFTNIKSSTLSGDAIQSERNKAFDLMDALSQSGSLSIAFSELHVIVCVTHSFEKNHVMSTLIKDNIDPIEKLEMSALLVASTIHGTPANTLIGEDEERRRLTSNFPSLLEARGSENKE